MTKLLRGLVDDELVYRIADDDDSRAWLIAISDKGTRALVEWRTQLADALGSLFADLDETEWGVLDHAAQLLATRVSTEAVPA
jgi:DNA-binding MarR family transcriptional regulator